MKIVVKEREFIMDKFQLEGEFSDILSRVKNIHNRFHKRYYNN